MKHKILTLLLAIVASTSTLFAVSGTCGDNLTWNLTGNGVLTISGTGAMSNYTSSSPSRAPWYSNRSSIKSVVIEEGVTSIGEYAFNGCSGFLLLYGQLRTSRSFCFSSPSMRRSSVSASLRLVRPSV